MIVMTGIIMTLISTIMIPTERTEIIIMLCMVGNELISLKKIA